MAILTKLPEKDSGAPPLPAEPASSTLRLEYEKKLRRRIEDRLRKDREALLLVARVLNIT
jgi:hypothetical protein